ncbi:SET domain-containing protein [Aspergillus clavatus NRRL 1]|uniref:SET domain protein n=1 Tax=Aspergillus clavatus (strain ATCC 1007 / CBS 513.65 / DSM 816 / NCTC 3887 / NRRL 1 / QM 1276 / 107) TaxID=344612 RepID=A1CPA6_ASPCL|nr:SET domain protein [Aspergillus clavatus NRRL 1]EAW07477.1 SET domain protein [Aspergillus clavatus NRRL 1]
MRRDYLPVESLPSWAKLNSVSIDGVTFQKLHADDGTDKGSAIIATEQKGNGLDTDEAEAEATTLLRVPSDLVLSLELVHQHAKTDHYLREVLDAVGDFSRTARGAIIIFLILQITHCSPDFADEHQTIGISNPWTEYIRFMPPSIRLPTFYTEAELELLRGTSLRTAVFAKLASLEKEFERLRQSTEGIPWCQKYWWDEDTGRLTFDDWKYVDAVYRSRVVELPESGHAIVPCVDMANHASEDSVKARYDESSTEDALLQLRQGRRICSGEEVTISYGSEKPASEMVFSYGFVENERTDAKQIFLDLEIPDDDPLRMAKQMFCKEAPGVRVCRSTSTSPDSGQITWDSPFVWWACVNEEDGLNFTVAQTTDGGRELRASWKGEDMDVPSRLKGLLSADPLWDIYQLRAVVLILERLETQLVVLRETEKLVSEINSNEDMRALFRPDVLATVSKLRKLEADLLDTGIEDLMKRRQELIASEAVTLYLNQPAEDVEEDFS